MNNTDQFNNNGTQSIYQRVDWYVPVAVHAFLILVVTWIIISLVHFGLKTGKWRKTQTTNFEKLNAGWVYTSVIVCAFVCLLRLIVALTTINVGFKPNENHVCNVMADLTSCFYALLQMSTLSFLWLRQTIFYSNSMLSVNYTKIGRYFSGASLVFIVICALGLTIFSTLPDDHEASPDGCIYTPDDRLRIGYWIFIVLVVLFVHGSLFGLLFNALRKSRSFVSKPHKRKQQKKPSTTTRSISSDGLQYDMTVETSAECSDTSAPVKTVSETISSNRSALQSKPSVKKKPINTAKLYKTNKPVQQTIQKTFVFATITILADIFLAILLLFINVHVRVVVALYSFNAVLNLLFVIFSFVYYKKILFSFFC